MLFLSDRRQPATKVCRQSRIAVDRRHTTIPGGRIGESCCFPTKDIRKAMPGQVEYPITRSVNTISLDPSSVHATVEFSRVDGMRVRRRGRKTDYMKSARSGQELLSFTKARSLLEFLREHLPVARIKPEVQSVPLSRLWLCDFDLDEPIATTNLENLDCLPLVNKTKVSCMGGLLGRDGN